MDGRARVAGARSAAARARVAGARSAAVRDRATVPGARAACPQLPVTPQFWSKKD